MDKETRRAIIMDNYQNPIHRGLKDDDSYIKKNTKSDSCIDNIEMMMKINNGKIVDVVFDGEACAICTSATNILCDKLMGKSVSDAEIILDNYRKMINEEEYDESILGELNVYEDLYLQPSRKNCALMPGNTAGKILDEVSHGD